jgi:thymidylate synthase (FAD)
MVTVNLMHNTPLNICSHAVRTCWQSFGKSDNGGPKDRELIERVGNKFKHSSTLEHLVYTFYIQGISRALLQELARHRIASLSVKSTRYTLKELQDEPPFYDPITDVWDFYRVEQYCVLTKNFGINLMIAQALDNVRVAVLEGVPNDIAKFALPDAYRTELTWTINARSLQNFLSLRTPKSAMWEIRRLAYAVFEALPNDHKYLFEPFVEKEEQ